MTAEDLIKRFEGCRLEAYPDPATGGKPYTIGYGCTGPNVTEGLTITQEQADQMLAHRLSALRGEVQEMITAPVTNNQLAALLSLAWNIGDFALRNSTLLKKLNTGDMQGTADEFLKWSHAAGKVMPGLLMRRKAERLVFLDNTQNSNGDDNAPLVA